MTIPLSLGVGPRSPRVKPHRWVREPTRDLQKFDKRFFPLLLGLVDRISNVGIEPFFFFSFFVFHFLGFFVLYSWRTDLTFI